MLIVPLFVIGSLLTMEPDITGTWTCDPYVIRQPSITARVSETHVNLADGTSTTEATAEYTLDSGEKIVVNASFSGTWRLLKGSLRTTMKSVEVSSVSPELFSNEEAEKILMQSVGKGDWKEYNLTLEGDEMVVERLDPPAWLITPRRSCKRKV